MTRRSWAGLAMVSGLVLVVQLPGPHATAWHFFELAVDLLVGNGPPGDRDGLGLYADHPELQFGPISILAAAPFVWLGGNAGELAVMIVTSAAGLLVVRALFGIVESDPLRPPPRLYGSVVAVSAILIVITWGDVAVRTAHIDDAIALGATLVAVRALVTDRAGVATVALAVAAAAKPWAVVFVPLAALPPGSWRLGRPVLAASLAVATWVPFILAEPDTLDTREFGITNDPTSTLRALGIDAASTPGWVRPAQLVGGLVVVGLVVWRRGWPGAVLAGVSWRLLLDPGAHRYYTIGFVLGALLLESRIRPNKVPWFSVIGAIALELTALPDAPAGLGQALRLGVVVAALAAAFWPLPPNSGGPPFTSDPKPFRSGGTTTTFRRAHTTRTKG